MCQIPIDSHTFSEHSYYVPNTILAHSYCNPESGKVICGDDSKQAIILYAPPDQKNKYLWSIMRNPESGKVICSEYSKHVIIFCAPQNPNTLSCTSNSQRTITVCAPTDPEKLFVQKMISKQ